MIDRDELEREALSDWLDERELADYGDERDYPDDIINDEEEYPR